MSINAQFEHLDTGQRNHIYHAVHNAGQTFYAGNVRMSWLMQSSERRKMMRRMARRYGVKQRTIEAVYIHVHMANQRRRIEDAIINTAIKATVR